MDMVYVTIHVVCLAILPNYLTEAKQCSNFKFRNRRFGIRVAISKFYNCRLAQRLRMCVRENREVDIGF
jgi:hypothetical protein